MEPARKISASLIITSIVGFLLGSLVNLVAAQPDYYNSNNNNNNGYNGKALFPSIFNLATNAIITSNATCGTDGPESYCKLVEHVFLRQPQCDVCDDANQLKRHPVEYAIDGTNRFWLSPSLANGFQNEKITITLDLRQRFQVFYVIIKSGIAPRPGNWILEKSLDGVNWTQWQVYAMSHEDCRQLGFNASNDDGHPKYTREDEVSCMTHHSKLDPLENGEIHTSIVNGRPGIDNQTELLMNFTTARFVRLRLLKLRTLHADLMIITRNQQISSIDKSVTRRYFYSIRDISIGGQCICYGHAESCPSDPSTGQLRCACQHNTCGDSCNECCPLFHQVDWHHGTINNSHVCEQCQCFNHANDCKYDKEVAEKRQSVNVNGVFYGGGVCIDCQHNTQGINCQECKDAFYRPAGISHYDPHACRPCDCDLSGAIDENCIKDDNRASENQRSGDCICKDGFGGRRCDRCALGFRNHPVCDPCPCNKHGSANYATCDSTCVCKENVEGEFCDRCKPGTFNLDENNPLGCTPCFCSGKSKECVELQWGKAKIQQLQGWKLTDLDSRRNVTPADEIESSLVFDNNKIPDQSLYFWKAPSDYRGNLLTSYGGYLKYFVYFVPQGEGHPLPLPDVVIKGNGLSIEFTSRQQLLKRENVSVSVYFHESASWYHSSSRQPVNKVDFMRVLSNVGTFLIKAMYNQNQIQASIFGVSLDRAEQTSENTDKMTSVEQCICPENYDGLSCEACVPGFRRVNNMIFDGQCERCECNDHSLSCDAMTGFCMNCLHHTAGVRCEVCDIGYYGNALLGPEACQRCACPQTNDENNFSPTCQLTEYSLTIDDYLCTECVAGYIGNHCEMCADGYFGDPKANNRNQTCKLCECTDNIDLAAVGNCDHHTGKCLKCISNTEGHSCEKCKEGYYGSAYSHNCTACECNLYGAESRQCDNSTGICACKDGYIGKRCDRCQDGHGDIENGCPACECSKVGALAETCDQVSGQCDCKPGIFGKHCDHCRAGYYNFSESGCIYCNCYELGSDQGKDVCDVTTGQCFCKINVEGRTCTSCKEGYFNITSGKGCQPCNCHEIGATDTNCDQYFGQCKCKPGVTGLQCDKCLPGHYGLSAEGCKLCPICPAPGHVCHPETGECICPPLTVGGMCENCEDEAWNYHPLKGCERCSCESHGSKSQKCDARTGQCECREKYKGRSCDMCQHGTYGFPDCDKCRCSKPGTEPSTCKNGLGCGCDEIGNCTCKANVEGEKCKACKAYSFSLEAEHPKGCTECFCFNRTDFCIQSSLTWQQMFGDNRLAIFSQPWTYYERHHGLHVFPSDGAVVNSYPTDQNPLYWKLPDRFLGDKTQSYNGNIRFTITNTDRNSLLGSVSPDRDLFHRYPLAVLVGNHRIILEYFQDRPRGDDGSYSVKLREDLWKIRNHNELKVSRPMLMVALQNLQAVYVRGTFVYGPSEASISDISLDIAVLDNSSLAINNTAIGVEQCVDCPEKYSGLSCQNPAEGYCRKKKPKYLDSMNDLDLIGWAEPCSCNSHSSSCDRETCICTNCQHDTIGDHCERCAKGFYGDAKQGTSTSCKPCRCPMLENNFSDSCVPVSYGLGYNCNNCQRGYEGQYCEMCSTGFYGDPNVVNGTCKACKCNLDGSLHGICNKTNGQCACREGVTGRDCSECQPRHALINRVCTSCDHGCYIDLMADIDFMEAHIDNYNFTGLVPAPWGRLAKMENHTAAGKAELESIQASRKEAEKMFQEPSNATNAESVLDRALYRQEVVNKSALAISHANENATKLLEEEINQLYYKSRDLIRQLEGYHGSGGRLRASPTRVAEWVTEATYRLDQMRNITELLEKRFNRVDLELEKAKTFFSQVVSGKLNESSLESLRHRLGNLTSKLEELRGHLWDSVSKNVTQAKALTGINQRMTEQFDKINEEMKEIRTRAENGTNEAYEQVESAKKMLLNTHDIYTELNDTQLAELENATQECDMRGTQFRNLLPEYEHKYKYPADRHVHTLTIQAEHIKASFRDVKHNSQLAVNASKAYADIARAIQNATVAADNARDASENSDSKLKEQGSIVDQTETSKDESRKLLAAAEKLSVEGPETKRKAFENQLSTVNDKLNNQKKSHDAMKSSFSGFDEIHGNVAPVKKKADASKKKAFATESDVSRVSDQIKELDKTIQEIKSFTSKGIKNVTSEVMNSVKEANGANQRLQQVQSQAEENDRRIASLGERLALLNEKIREAKERASKIKLSVTSKEGSASSCLRTYSPKLGSAVVNEIRLKYRPTQDVKDSLIFMIRTPGGRKPDEYLAIELHQRWFKFIWNVGEKDESLVNTKRIDPLLPVPSNNPQSWYLISVKRINNYAELNVSKVIGKDIVEQVSVAHGDKTSARVFNYDVRKSEVTLGARPEHRPKKLDVGEFKGTIGELEVDGENIPLWNFASEEKSGCGGSYPDKLHNQDIPASMFSDGYAVVSSVSKQFAERPKESKIEITFSTYTEDGLLYFRGDSKNKDFISLEMFSGFLRFQFFLGGSAKFSVNSQFKYNDGKFYTVIASRDVNNGHLIVESEDISRPVDGDMKSLDVRESDHYIGGVPESLPKKHWESFGLHWSGFYGCVKRVVWAGLELDIHKPQKSLNVEAGCVTRDDSLVTSDRIVQFAQEGFLAVGGIEFADQSSLAVSFRTSEPNGVILYQSSRATAKRKVTHHREARNVINAGKGFISVYLHEGILHARLGIDQNLRIELTSTAVYNDEKTRSMLLMRSGREVTLFVDDEKIAAKELPTDEAIGSSKAELFLGGVGTRQVPDSEIDLGHEQLSFLGCISDLFFNYQRTPLMPLELEHAKLGSCKILDPATAEEKPQADAFLADQQNATAEAFTAASEDPVVSAKSAAEAAYDDEYEDEEPDDGRLQEIQDQRAVNRPARTGTTASSVEAVAETATSSSEDNLQPQMDESTTTKATAELTTALPAVCADVPEPATEDADASTTVFYGLCGRNSYTRVHIRADPSPQKEDAKKQRRTRARTEEERRERRKLRKEGKAEKNKDERAEQQSLAIQNFALSLKFRTKSLNGLLLVWSNPKNDHYVNISLVNGELVANLRKTARVNLSLKVDAAPLNDGVWHTVQLSKQNVVIDKAGNNVITVRLQLDDYKPQEANSTGIMSMKMKPLFIGGVPQKRADRYHLNVPSFKGCIGNFLLNRNSAVLRKDAKPKPLLTRRANSVTPCYQNVICGASFKGTGFYQYDEEREITADGRMSFQLDFRTTNASGKLLVLANSDLAESMDSPYLILEILNGQVIATINNGGSKADPVILETRSPTLFNACDGSWHSLKLEISQTSTTLSIHDDTFVHSSSANIAEFNSALNTLPVYIGGVPDSLMSTFHWPSKANFAGCIRNLELQGRRVDWLGGKLHRHGDVENFCPSNF